MKIKLALVIPCFNEELSIESTIKSLNALIISLIYNKKISNDSIIMFVDDGSHDNSWLVLSRIAKTNKRVHAIKLARNYGHQNALLAGLYESSNYDAIISLDADLQDDISIIPEMIDKASSGSDIVYGVRKKREGDSFFKKISAESYYKLMKFFGVNLLYNHADYRLMTKKSLNALLQHKERNLFLRGMVAYLGFNTSIIYYDRLDRLKGETKYSLLKMISLGWQGITSFSLAPLRIVITLGFFVSLLSLILILWVLWTFFVEGAFVPGWASTLIPILFIGGIQILSIGVLGEYIGKIYIETKNRPNFIISEKL